MKLFTQFQYDQLIKNGKPENRDKDHVPVVWLFLPGTSMTWLLTEIDEIEPLAFGLCDLGTGFPELGYIDLNELTELKTPWGSVVERDLQFEGVCGISYYAEAARICQYVTHDPELLERLSTARKNQFELKL